MSPLLFLSMAFFAFALLALVAALVEHIAENRRKKVLDETLPPPEWGVKRIRHDDWEVEVRK